LRKSFATSSLVRVLGDLDLHEVDAPRLDVAERLESWVGIAEASTLHAAHLSITALAQAQPARPARRAQPPGKTMDLAEQLQQTRAMLTRAITTHEPAATSKAPMGRPARHAHMQATPATQGEAVPEAEVDYAIYRQHYLDQQRNMELMIAPLRDHVRQALFASGSAGMRQLAGLDAVWEQLLGHREKNLLATLPAHLERRFKALRKTHQHDDPSTWRQPGGWLHGFGQELRAVLLAELETRLEPVTGLVEAFSTEFKRHA
jgi:hypothetical protein